MLKKLREAVSKRLEQCQRSREELLVRDWSSVKEAESGC